jgi:hypothetical protein
VDLEAEPMPFSVCGPLDEGWDRALTCGRERLVGRRTAADTQRCGGPLCGCPSHVFVSHSALRWTQQCDAVRRSNVCSQMKYALFIWLHSKPHEQCTQEHVVGLGWVVKLYWSKWWG